MNAEEIKQKLKDFDKDNQDLFRTKPFVFSKNNVLVQAERIIGICKASMYRRISLNMPEIENSIAAYKDAIDEVVKEDIEEDTKLRYLAIKQDAVALGALMSKRNYNLILEGFEIVDTESLPELEQAMMARASACPKCLAKKLVMTHDKKLGRYSVLCASCGHYYSDRKIPVDTSFSAITIWNTLNRIRADQEQDKKEG